MTESKTEPVAWPDQEAFLVGASRLVARVFRRLGADDVASLGFIAYPVGDSSACPPIARPGHALGWTPHLETWDADIRAAEERNARRRPSLWQIYVGLPTRITALSDVARAKAAEHEAATGARCFVSQVLSTPGYHIMLVLEVEAASAQRVPSVHVRAAASGLFPPCDVEVGMIGPVSSAVLAHAALAFNPEINALPRAKKADIDGILRDAGQNMMARVQRAVGASWLAENLFDDMNTISMLRYEGAEVGGGIVFGPARGASKLALRLADPVALAQPRWARKVLQMSAPPVWAYSDSERLFGLATRQRQCSEFRVQFKGHGRWSLSHAATLLADVEFGIPAVPLPRLDRGHFERTFRRVFPSAPDEGFASVWAVIQSALEQTHGTMIVVTSDADAEATRLASQAMRVATRKIPIRQLFRATTIDGAILLDPLGNCHAIGTILDGQASPRGSASRGARFNSALRYVDDPTVSHARLALVVSEDGHVNIFPRLRPQIRRVELDARVAAIRGADRAERPEALRRIALELLRYYSDYIEPGDWEAADYFAHGLPWEDDAEDAAVSEYDKHRSDFVE